MVFFKFFLFFLRGGGGAGGMYFMSSFIFVALIYNSFLDLFIFGVVHSYVVLFFDALCVKPCAGYFH